MLGNYQCGFRKGHPLLIVFMLRRILEKFYGLNLDLHLLFIDFKQAYDTINRMYSYEILN